MNARDLDLLGRLHRNGILAEFTEYRIDQLRGQTRSKIKYYLKGTIDFLANFSPGEYNLSGHEDQKDNLRRDHPVDQTRKQFRFILPLAKVDDSDIQMRTCRGYKPGLPIGLGI